MKISQFLGISALLLGLSATSYGTGSFSISTEVDDVRMNLGATQAIPYTLTATEDFSGGTIQLEVEAPELDEEFQANGTITFDVSPNSVELSAGQTVRFTVTANVSTFAPSFDTEESHFHVVAFMEGSTLVSTHAPHFAVNAIYETTLMDGTPGTHVWVPEKLTRQQNELIRFRRHAGGLTLRFHVHEDVAQSHVIHGNSPIRHQRISSGGTRPGEFYETVVAESDRARVGGFYCHDHESSRVEQRMEFNVPVESSDD